MSAISYSRCLNFPQDLVDQELQGIVVGHVILQQMVV